jgi:hypothetical protein
MKVEEDCSSEMLLNFYKIILCLITVPFMVPCYENFESHIHQFLHICAFSGRKWSRIFSEGKGKFCSIKHYDMKTSGRVDV